MKNIYTKMLAVLLLSAMSTSTINGAEVSDSQELTLVLDGTPQACIVTSTNPPLAVAMGVLDLQYHIKAITGGLLPVVTDAAAITGIPIFVGDSPAAAAAGFPRADWKLMEYRVHVSPGAIFLAGQDAVVYGNIDFDVETGRGEAGTFPSFRDSQGSLHAVYHFLEKHCGVRWWNGSELGTQMPNTPTLTVLAGANIQRQPDFLYRARAGNEGWRNLFSLCFWNDSTQKNEFVDFVQAAYPLAFAEQQAIDAEVVDSGRYLFAKRHLWNETDNVNYLFLMRNRFGGSENFSCNHSIRPFFFRFWEPDPRWPEYFIEHKPEWFVQDHPGTPHQLRYTHEEVVQQAAQDARDFFDGKLDQHLMTNFNASPGSDYFPLVPNDGWGFSLSPEAEALKRTDPVPYFSNGWLSEYWFSFVNRVARELKKTHPDKYIATLAYANYADYPNFPVEDNVAVMFCHSNRSVYDTQSNLHEDALMAKWVANHPNDRLYLWLYYTFPRERAGDGTRWHVFPGFFSHQIGEQYKKFKSNGFRGAFYNGWGEDIDTYLTLKMLEDASQSVEAILDEFFPSYYGEAAAPMRALYSMIENLYSDPSNYTAENPGGTVGHQTEVIAWGLLGTKANMVVMRELLAQAKQTAIDEIVQARVDIFDKGIFSYMEKGRSMYEAKLRTGQRYCRVPQADYEVEGSDPANVDWSDAFALVHWYNIYGEPTLHTPIVRVAHDTNMLYLRYDELNHPASPRRAGEPESARITFMLALNPNFDLRVLSISPAGDAQTEIRTLDGGVEPWVVNPIIHSVKTDEAWTVEVAIPLDGAGLENATRFQFNAAREGDPNGDIAVWVPTLGPLGQDRYQLAWLVLDQEGPVMPLSPPEIAQLDTQDLVGRWTFDEVDGLAVLDRSGNGLDGSFSTDRGKSPPRVAGLNGQGLNCTGERQSGVVVPFAPALNISNGPMTVEMWIKPNPKLLISEFPILITRMDDTGTNVFNIHLRREWTRIAFRLYLEEGSAPSFWSQDWPREENNIVPYFQWTHLVGVWDGAQVSFFMNGRPHGTPVAVEGPLLDMDAPLYIGAPPKHNIFRGVIDDVSIYRRTLSPAEVRGRFLQQLAPLDIDGNGIIDDWEIDNFGLVGIDTSADPDGDRVPNYFEYIFGSDPNDSVNRGSNIELYTESTESGKKIVMTFTVHPGMTLSKDYQIYVSTDLNSWSELPPHQYTFTEHSDELSHAVHTKLLINDNYTTPVFFKLTQP